MTVHFCPEGTQIENSVLLQDIGPFVLFKPSTEWIGPASI